MHDEAINVHASLILDNGYRCAILVLWCLIQLQKCIFSHAHGADFTAIDKDNDREKINGGEGMFLFKKLLDRYIAVCEKVQGLCTVWS